MMTDEAGTVSKTAVQMVLDFVQEGLRDGRLTPGARLPKEGDIAEAVGVSRTPVREGIKVLEAIGVVEIRRGVGTYLRPQASGALSHLLVFQAHVQNTSAHDLFQTRLMIERSASELAALNRSEADVERLLAANRTLRAIAAQPGHTLDQLLEADIGFHHVVFDICGNAMIAALGRFIIAEFAPWIRESLRQGGGERAARNHDMIIAMIEYQNAPGASAAVYDRAIVDGLLDFARSIDGVSGGDAKSGRKAADTGGGLGGRSRPR